MTKLPNGCAANPDWCWTITYNRTGEQLKFSASGFLTADLDRNGVGTTFQYSSGQMVQAVQASGRAMAFTYDSSGVLQSTTDSASRTTTYSRNSSSQLSKVTSVDGAVMTFTYDSTGRLSKITAPTASISAFDTTTVVFAYDTQHRVTKVTQKSSSATWGSQADLVTTYTYTSGQTKLTDPRGNVTTYAIDSSGRVTSTADPLSRTHAQTWTPSSKVASTTDALGSGSTPGNQTTYSYDQLANTTGATLPTGAAAQAIYAQGANCPSVNGGSPYQVKCSIDASGNSTQYEYDAAGNTTREADTTGGANTTLSAKTYSTGAGSCSPIVGQVCTATNGKGAVTSYSYDSHGNLTQVTPPSPLGITTYTYDSLGRPISVTDGNATVTGYNYDAADRLTKTTFNSNVLIYNGYFLNGLQEYTADTALLVNTWYAYDQQGLTTSKAVTNFDFSTILDQTRFQYDPAGNLIRYEDSVGPVSYGYDPANQVRWLNMTGGTCVDDDTSLPAGSDCVKIRYDANGAEVKRILPGGAQIDRTYDGAGRMSGLVSANGSGINNVRAWYYNANGYGASDPAGDRSTLQYAGLFNAQGVAAQTRVHYQYDTQGRLTLASEYVSSSPSTTTASWAYTYDGAGNRLTQTRAGATGATAGTTTWTYNEADQVTTMTGSSTAWTYDGVGNQIKNGRTGEATAFNDRGQVTAISSATYTAFGIGNAEPVSRNSETYRSSPLGLSTSKNGTAAATSYVRMPDGQIVGSRTGTARNYFVVDNQDSVIGIYNGHANGYQGGYTYSPYGEARFTASTTTVVNNPIRYISGYYDAVTSMYKLGARFYDTNLGRFTQMDPSGQEVNPFLYAAGDPINKFDPSGQNSLWVIGAVGDVLGFVDLALAAYAGDSRQVAIELVSIGVGWMIGTICAGIVGGSSLFAGPIGATLGAAGCIVISSILSSAVVGFN